MGRAIYGVSAGRDSPSLLPAPLRTRVYLCTSASTVAGRHSSCLHNLFSEQRQRQQQRPLGINATQRASSSGRFLGCLPAVALRRRTAQLPRAAKHTLAGSEAYGREFRRQQNLHRPALDLATSGRPETRSDIVEPSAGLPTTQAHGGRAEASRSVGVSHPE